MSDEREIIIKEINNIYSDILNLINNDNETKKKFYKT